MPGPVDRILLHPWVARIANGAFLVGAATFLIRSVILQADLWTFLGVAFMALGLVLNQGQRRAAHHAATSPVPEQEDAIEPHDEAAVAGDPGLAGTDEESVHAEESVEEEPEPEEAVPARSSKRASSGETPPKRLLQRQLEEGERLLDQGVGSPISRFATGFFNPDAQIDLWTYRTRRLLRKHAPYQEQRFAHAKGGSGAGFGAFTSGALFFNSRHEEVEHKCAVLQEIVDQVW